MSEIENRPYAFSQHRVFKTLDKGELDTIVELNGAKHRPKEMATQLTFKLVKGLFDCERRSVWQLENQFQACLSFHQGKQTLP
jgi:hypothetical protein